ncbi:MAG: monooxygenase [Myxococcota bacterium]
MILPTSRSALGRRHGAAALPAIALTLALGCSGDVTPPGSDDAAAGTTDGGSEDGPAGTDADTGAADSTTSQDEPLTYHRDIRPVLERHCVSCHSDGQIAPYALTSYAEVEPLREAIAAAVSSRQMPPWNPRPGCAEYVGDPSLTDEAMAAVTAWAEGDALEGDAADFVPPTLPEPSGISRVDTSLTLAEPYTPQLAPDDYRCFVMDWPYEEATYITGFEVVPDNLDTVHHVISYAIEPEAVATYEALDANDPGPGYTCFGGPGGGGTSFSNGRWLGAWAPGAQTSDFPAGTGLRMEPGSKVVVQIHYNSVAGEAGPDQSTIDYRVDPTVEREAYMMPWTDPDWVAGGMYIPPDSASTTHVWELDPTAVMSFITDVIPPNEPIEIHSVSHHMHLRGAQAQQQIKRADGTSDCLVEIDDYDFNWQTRYRFGAPKILNPGDQLSLTCNWDNSGNDAGINWGEGTEDEMCLGVYFIAPLP